MSRHTIGSGLLNTQIQSAPQLEEAEREFEKWDAFNQELIRRMFSGEEYMHGYNSAYPMIGVSWNGRTFSEEVHNHFQRVKYRLDYLESLAERLDLIGESPDVSEESDQRSRNDKRRDAPSQDIFLVHGRDEEMKNIVARFIEKCRLKPIILAEQADEGRTIIEKFEASSNVGFAVVLLSPDDVGGLAPEATEDPILQNRARQNVILELGYFVGKLGRPFVCALKKGDLELPSDFSGVVYTPFSADEGWKIKLAREIKAAGIEIDLNDALG